MSRPQSHRQHSPEDAGDHAGLAGSASRGSARNLRSNRRRVFRNCPCGPSADRGFRRFWRAETSEPNDGCPPRCLPTCLFLGQVLQVSASPRLCERAEPASRGVARTRERQARNAGGLFEDQRSEAVELVETGPHARPVPTGRVAAVVVHAVEIGPPASSRLGRHVL